MPIRRSGGEKGRNFRQVRQLSFHGSRDALVRSVRSVVVCSSGSAPSLCYCVPCLPGQSLALLRVGASALPGASCACVWPPLGTRAVAYCARMEAVAAYISCREKCGPCVDSCRWEWATVSELIGEGNYVCIAMHGS